MLMKYRIPFVRYMWLTWCQLESLLTAVPGPHPTGVLHLSARLLIPQTLQQTVGRHYTDVKTAYYLVSYTRIKKDQCIFLYVCSYFFR